MRHRIRKVTSNPQLQRTMYITEQNLATPQFMEIPNAWGTVTIQARGAGYAIAQLPLQYNVDVNRFVTPPAVKALSYLQSR